MAKETSQPPFQVNCPRCHVSFPIGTKRCIHCGGPLGRGLAALLSQRRTMGAQPEFVLEEGVEEQEPEQEPEQGVQSPGRSLLWVITAAYAVGISMLRSCMEG